MENTLLLKIRNQEALSKRECVLLIGQLSMPAIFAQLSSTLMSFIDAAMVGRIGANASASIGLVASTTWLLGGVMVAVSTGFTVQVAHYVGAKKEVEARNVVKEGLFIGLIFSLILTLLGVGASFVMPQWLGGKPEIIKDARNYLLFYSLFNTFDLINYVSGGMLQCSGNIKIPSILNICMCILDVIFNFFFIFKSQTYNILGLKIFIPGFNLGVTGAAVGTGMSYLVIMCIMLYVLLFKSEILHLRKGETFSFKKEDLQGALKIGLPVGIEQLIMGTSYVMVTKIVAPLGTISIATNSFAITAEGLCYMPGYGIGTASTTIVGQAVGAKRKELTKTLSYLCVFIGSIVMLFMGALMFINAKYLMMLLSTNTEIISLGTKVLRIEAFAEMMYGASIVGAAVFRGMGKTLGSSVINLVSVWAVRIPLMFFLSHIYGLVGVWIGMCIELNVRGLLYVVRLIYNFRKDESMSN